MSTFVLPLADTNAILETVGGKGMSLASLLRANLPVPGGFHVTTAAYRAFVTANGLQPRILEIMASVDSSSPAALESASDQIRALFTAAAIPLEITEEITAAYQSINQPSAITNQQSVAGEPFLGSLEQPALPVAVRSSATAEDLPDASFAGQQDTYLNIRGTEAVLDAVRRCWASLWTARAIGYRARQGIDPDSVALAVVVQELVFADAAGIMFTANPVNGKRSEAIINAAWGLGEAIVGGMVTPDTLTVEKATGRVIQRETADKQIMTLRTETGTTEQPVPAEKRTQPVLSDAQAAELAKLGTQIEGQYGMPMDIEWALILPSPSRRGAGGDVGFYILQARPITALPAPAIEWVPPDPKGIYMRGSVVDLLPSPLTPLFVSLGIPALQAQMQPMGKRMLGSWPYLTPDYFTSINHYAYMNAYIPPKMFWWIIMGMLPAYPRLLRQLVALWRDELHPEYRAVAAQKQALNLAQMTEAELWQEAQALVDAAMFYVCGLMFATMGASAGSEMLLTKLYDKWAYRQGDPPATALLMGWDNIPARAEKSLYDLAQWARTLPGLADYLLATPTEQLLIALSDLRINSFVRATHLGHMEPPLAQGLCQQKPESAPGGSPLRFHPSGCGQYMVSNSLTPNFFPAFASRFQTHLDQFGHIIYQLDFAEPLPRDNPAPMLENIKMYLRGEGVNPHERQQASQTRRIQTAETMLARLKGIKGWGFRKALNWAQSLSEVREDALAEIGLAYPQLRKILRELGRRFAAATVFDQPDDIFWLEKGEIDRLIAGEHLSLHGLVAERKAFHAQLKTVTPPPMMPVKERIMGIKVDTFVAQTADSHTASVLKGVPASPGRVTAPARLLHGPQDFSLMRPGEVLVAGTTTPAWTPLFAMASAVVTDIGGPLSHGSIVAREYGIPAVMGTGVATKRIHSGDSITVDGGSGQVFLAESTPEAALPTEWVLPNPTFTYARASLAEHTPSPATPLFATFGLEIANQATSRLWKEILREGETSELYNDYFYQSINGYVYSGFRITLKELSILLRLSYSQIGTMFGNGLPRWQAARDQLAAVVDQWESKQLASLSPNELLDGVRTLFGEACRYFTVLQTTLPVATMSEMIFTRIYNGLIKRKQDPEATVFLFGLNTAPLQAEKALYDLALWARQQPGLETYLLQTPTADIVRALTPDSLTPIPSPDFTSRLAAYLHQHGRTAYEFDFAHPTPAETPGALLDAIKAILSGQASSPYERQQAAVERYQQATQDVIRRVGWPRKGWFEKLLRWARETGPLRENSIFNLGMGHLMIRQIWVELGRRFVDGRAIEAADDIYWLEKAEVEELVSLLETGQALPILAGRIPARKARCEAQRKLTPPTTLPEKSRLAKFSRGGQVKRKDGKVMLKGVGTSSGTVTAPACVLFGPEDFARMKPGDVLVAVTTAPAWTPLFAQAAAVVTDIGGPLSHSSIVAREYGIPAVMATRVATRKIQNGQMITVDGAAGTVEVR
jgi:pyruvate,water dikinase